jgi:hypothetical protein
MRKKNKVALIIILIAVVAGATSWALIKKNNAKPDCDTTDPANLNGECKVDLSSIQSATSTSTAQNPTPTSTTAANFSDLYHNAQYGFDLTFNSAWKGYTVSRKSEDKAEAVYDIGIPTKDSNITNGIAVPLTVKIFNKADYQANSTLTKITENATYVFVYSIWEQAPSDAAVTEKDIANVISTFKLN